MQDVKDEFFNWLELNNLWGQNEAQKQYAKCNKPFGNIEQNELRSLVTEYKKLKGIKPKIKNISIKMEKVLQINDLHVPFHDKKSIKAFMDFASNFNPDKIVLAGDILDFYKLSTFDKDPARIITIQDEIDVVYPILKDLKSLAKEVHFIKGNHEDRLLRYLKRNPELASIKALELHKLLNLDLLNIEYHPYEYIFNDFRFTHGSVVRAESGMSARAERLKYGGNTSSGHTHRLGNSLKTDSRGTIAGYEMGCMCDMFPEFISGIPNWQQGFGVFYFNDNRFYCQQVPIIDNKFIYDGRLYQ